MSNGGLRIGLSACFFHPDPQRDIFKGKTLLFVEQSMAHYLMAAGVMPQMVPSPGGGMAIGDLVTHLDGLVLQGGADVAPTSYGETPLRDEWTGDAVRDAYEIALVKECLAQDVPVFGICRGVQILNVAFGGTLYQDITTQQPDALVHRDWHTYDRLVHDITVAEDSGLAELYPAAENGTINSVHHQGIKDVGAGLRAEAWSPKDGIVEALRYNADPDRYLFGVQWHPEFMNSQDDGFLEPQVLLTDFLAAVRQRTS